MHSVTALDHIEMDHAVARSLDLFRHTWRCPAVTDLSAGPVMDHRLPDPALQHIATGHPLHPRFLTREDPVAV